LGLLRQPHFFIKSFAFLRENPLRAFVVKKKNDSVAIHLHEAIVLYNFTLHLSSAITDAG
jgi:hypothetical protein